MWLLETEPRIKPKYYNFPCKVHKCKNNKRLKEYNHGLRGSGSPVLRATGFVNGKGQFSTPYGIDTPQPITKRIVTGDSAGDPNSLAKLGAHPSTGGLWANG